MISVSRRRAVAGLIFIVLLGGNSGECRDLSPQARKIRCVRDTISGFLNAHVQEKDAYLGATSPLRGVPFSQTFDYGSGDVRVFRQLGDGTYGMAYLGVHDGELVVVKRLKDAAPDWIMDREAQLTAFLAKKGYVVSPVLDSSVKDRTMLKRFVPGFYEKDLEKELGRGAITETKMARAEKQLRDLQYGLKKLQASGEYKAWAASKGFPVFIDTDESNFLYQDGRWILIDP